MSASRREFLFGAGKLILILPVGFSIVDTLVGCGTGPGGGATCGNAGKVTASATSVVVTSSCESQHTHDFTLMTTELTSPPASGVTRDASVDAFDSHTHSVMLTVAELNQIEGGTTVTKTSSTTNSHSHTFAFKKA